MTNQRQTDFESRAGRMPDHWINLAAQVRDEFPLPQDEEGTPVGEELLSSIYPEECARIELLLGDYGGVKNISIPGIVLDEYRKYRPTPLQRAFGLEKHFGYDGKILFKREDMNPTGSHKPNTGIAQVHYAQKQGLKELTTDTGAGQWGSALAWACQNFGLRCTVFMTRNSYLAKPYRRHMMALCGTRVIASPSNLTAKGRSLFDANPDHSGSLGIGMGEAMEYATRSSECRLALGCMSYYSAMHQTVIGQELAWQLDTMGIEPDVLFGCVGGGTNFVGFVSAFVSHRLAEGGQRNGGPRLVAVESANVPALTQGTYRYEHADAFGMTPRVKMYTLGRQFMPPEIHAGGLRYHGKSPILSLLVNKGLVEAAAVMQEEAFAAGKLFFETDGILVAPETAHAIAQVISQVTADKAAGKASTIVFCLSGTGYLDLEGYARFFQAADVLTNSSFE